jgi:transposase InsO family protein
LSGFSLQKETKAPFFASLECELLWQETLRSRQEAKLAVFDFIEGWYNTQRRHSGLDYMSLLPMKKVRARFMRPQVENRPPNRADSSSR